MRQGEREDHPDNRFCRREIVAQLTPQPQAASATAYREGKGGGRGGKDNKKKTLIAPEKSDTEYTVLDGGAYLGYEEMVYARRTGASTQSNLLDYLTNGEPLATVCTALASSSCYAGNV